MAEKIGLARYRLKKSDDVQVIWGMIAGGTQSELGRAIGALRRQKDGKLLWSYLLNQAEALCAKQLVDTPGGNMFLEISPFHLGVGLDRSTHAFQAVDRQGAAPHHLGGQSFIFMSEFILFVGLNV
jgi:hypothetical protein